MNKAENKNGSPESGWINTILDLLRDTDSSSGRKILERCGRRCFKQSESLIKAADIAKRTKGMDNEAILKIVQEEIFGQADDAPIIHQQDGMIFLNYSQCLCDVASREDYQYDGFLCECTKGYAKALIEAVFERQAEITILKTVLRGDDNCLLAIRLI